MNVMESNYFSLRQLSDKFYEDNTHLERVLDKSADTENFIDKGRGYGIVIIELHNLKFGIPLRSRMTHKFCFSTETTRDEVNNRTYRKGLDYTKAVLLSDDEYITERSFRIPSNEFDKINDSQERIKQQFTKFVERYITAYRNRDQNLLTKNYRDTTLINYHKELGLDTDALQNNDSTNE